MSCPTLRLTLPSSRWPSQPLPWRRSRVSRLTSPWAAPSESSRPWHLRRLRSREPWQLWASQRPRGWGPLHHLRRSVWACSNRRRASTTQGPLLRRGRKPGRPSAGTGLLGRLGLLGVALGCSAHMAGRIASWRKPVVAGTVVRTEETGLQLEYGLAGISHRREGAREAANRIAGRSLAVVVRMARRRHSLVGNRILPQAGRRTVDRSPVVDSSWAVVRIAA
jgi:hypothetical protein